MSSGAFYDPRTVTISNPLVPFETVLNKVQPGLSVAVHGQRIEGQKIFFQFQTGSGENADIAFRFVPRWVYDPEVIGNSRIGGNWGDEDRFIVGSMPLGKTGDTFQLLFVVEENHFKVAVNGSHFCSYPHRMNLYSIRYFGVQNAARLLQVAIYNQQEPITSLDARFRKLNVGSASTSADPSQRPQEIKPILRPSNDKPFQLPFKNIRDHSLTIAGELLARPRGRVVPEGDACYETLRRQHSGAFFRGGTASPAASANKQFSLQFLTSNPSNVFFAFTPHLERKIIDLNSRHEGDWEETTSVSNFFPFVEGQPFQIEIAVDQHCFRVFVNGLHLCNFQHRHKPLHKIKRIMFTGSVSIASVTFC